MGTLPTPFDPQTDDPGYLYVRLADYLKARIDDGTLRPGAMLPNERNLAAECGVSIGTTRKAIQLLQGRGLIITLRGRGTFIARTDIPDGRG